MSPDVAEKCARILKAIHLRIELDGDWRMSEDEHDQLDVAYSTLLDCASALRLAAIPQWQPIDTAADHFARTLHRFPCLLQEKNTGRVVEGYGCYMKFGRGTTPMRLRWYTAAGYLIYPEYWMPLPAPKVEA